MAIHAFGAYYGLAASYVLFTKRPAVGASHAKNGSAYLNDVFAMIGTIFLWVFWPSFNARDRNVRRHGHRRASSHVRRASNAARDRRWY